jgi:hypothetical protein
LGSSLDSLAAMERNHFFTDLADQHMDLHGTVARQPASNAPFIVFHVFFQALRAVGSPARAPKHSREAP